MKYSNREKNKIELRSSNPFFEKQFSSNPPLKTAEPNKYSFINFLQKLTRLLISVIDLKSLRPLMLSIVLALQSNKKLLSFPHCHSSPKSRQKRTNLVNRLRATRLNPSYDVINLLREMKKGSKYPRTNLASLSFSLSIESCYIHSENSHIKDKRTVV